MTGREMGGRDRQTGRERQRETGTERDGRESEVLRGDPGVAAGVFGVAHHTAGLGVELRLRTVRSVLV